MIPPTTLRRVPAKGSRKTLNRIRSPQVSTSYPEPLFDKISKDAARRGISFSAIVREKIILGYR